MNAYELIRVEKRKEPRMDWPERWHAAAVAVGFKGVMKGPRMIALKNSPIWEALGNGAGGFEDATGRSSPPFAFGSGMGWRELQVNDSTVILNSTYSTKEQAMQENKIKLITIVAALSDESCANILNRIYDTVLQTTPLANERKLVLNKIWEEDDHPRQDDGRFAPKGSMRSQMSKHEAKKWDVTGKTTPNPNRSEKLKSVKKEIDKLKHKVEFYEDSIGMEKDAMKYKEQLVKKQREYAEAVREWKRSERVEIESGAEKRIMMRKAKKYFDLEDDIDYIEEKYGDNPLGGELKFPKGKRGAKVKADYEEMLKKRDELLSEIDWDKVDDDEINAERQAGHSLRPRDEGQPEEGYVPPPDYRRDLPRGNGRH